MQCPRCGYRFAGYDGSCAKCETVSRSEAVVRRVPSGRNRTLNEIREDEGHSNAAEVHLPPGEPRLALMYDDYMDFLLRLQSRPMTESEVAERVIRRLESLAAKRITVDDPAFDLDSMANLSEISLAAPKRDRIRDVVMRHARKWKTSAPA